MKENHFILFFAFLALAFVGCVDDPAGAKVTGTVTLDGQPLANATVTFFPVDGSRMSVGATDAQGKYKLRFSASTVGAVAGEHKVEIRTAPEEADSEVTEKIVEKVPAKYNAETELKQTLKNGSQVVNFDLKSE